MQKLWVRTLPHIIDTCLLLSGITLAVMLQQFPFIQGWLTAKLLALCLYIVLGSIALKRGKTNRTKAIALFFAVATATYICSVAITRSPIIF